MNPYIQYMYSYPHKTAYGPLTGIKLKDYAGFLSGEGHGLYLHIPFCQTKCGYCNLFSVAGQGEAAVDRYLDAVERQSVQYAAVLSAVGAGFSQFVIGGGTPLALTERQLVRVFEMAEHCFSFSKDRTIAVETAPNQTTREKLAILKQAGVSRISMGIQSFSDRELGVLRRHHTADKAREALELLKSFAFACVNVDFIYGIPGQTKESLLASLEEAMKFGPEEVFLYPLYVRQGVSLKQEGVVTDWEAAYGQYRTASAFLQEKGYRQDSMRRFVKQGGSRDFSECGLGNSLGLGCGGRSYLGRLHFCTPYAVNAKECLVRLEQYESTEDYTDIAHGILLSQEELKRRYLIRHLLIFPGVDADRYQEQFHGDVLQDFPILQDWLDGGYLQYKKQGERTYLEPTQLGLGLSDYLGPQLISPMVRQAMEDWESTEPGADRK